MVGAAYRGVEVTKRIRTHKEEQKANATKNLAALRAKDETAFKAKKAKLVADSWARRTPGEFQDAVVAMVLA